MSILSNLQEWLEEFSAMSILTDQTGENTSSYALSPSGNELIEGDCLGNEKWKNSYIFLAKEAGANEVDRKENHDWLESFSDWVFFKTGLPELGENLKAKSVEVSNAMLYGVDEDGSSVYQIQIQLIYERNNELWQ